MSLVQTKTPPQYQAMNLCMKVKHLCISGDIESVTEMISKGIIVKSVKNNSLMWGLYGACYGGHMKLINLLIEHGADNWDYGLMGACEGGHYDIMYIMVTRGASDFNMALEGASSGGHIEIINITLANNQVDINYALRGACMTNQKHVVELAIQRGATDWNGGMLTACSYGYIDLVKLMILHGATDCNEGLYSACRGGHLNIIKLMLQMGMGTMEIGHFNCGLSNACMGFNIDVGVVKFMISLGCNNWSEALKYAYLAMNFDILQLLLDSSRGKIHTHDLLGVKESDDVRLYSLYCKYNIDDGGNDNVINPQKDKKFNELLQKYPPYVVLLSKITKNKQCNLSRLPYELHRLLHECFYKFTIYCFYS